MNIPARRDGGFSWLFFLTFYLIVYTIKMGKPFDPNKSEINFLKHGLSFQDVDDFEWDTVVTISDKRHDYGEDRKISYGLIKGRLHVLVYVIRDQDIRSISFRKANEREIKFYERYKL